MHKLWLSGVHTPVRRRGPRRGHFGRTEVGSFTGDLLGTLKSFSHDLQVTQRGFQYHKPSLARILSCGCISPARVRTDAWWRPSPGCSADSAVRPGGKGSLGAALGSR